MADGLSVAASVAGLIQIADIVVRRGYRYVRDVKEAEKSVERLIDEVNKLSGILHSLKNVAERCEDDKLEIEPTAQIHHIEACLKTLQLVDTHLENSNPATEKDHVGNVKQKLKWPLNRSKVKELLSEVEKHKAAMSLAMTASSMSALLVLLDRQNCIRENLLELKVGIEMDRKQRIQVELSDQRKKWLDSLSILNAQRWQDFNIKLRQAGSGIWFTDGPDFQEWLLTRRSKLWVHGIPGAGKTILMASAIQEALKHSDERHALAFFYCDYKDANTHNPRNIFGSLAKQIAVQNESCFHTLKEFWGTPGSPGRVSSTRGVPTIGAYLDLIKELAARFDNVMIIVDGLDEVAVDRSGVADLLQSLNRPNGNIKTLFASRKEIDLQHPLQSYKQLSIAAKSSDLRLYVASEIERRTGNKMLRIRDPDLKEHTMRTLVNRADGMFRWVTCQLDYLCECTNDRERREALTKLPPDLPSSYERILERINNSRNKSNRLLVIRALQWAVYSEWPLSTPALLEALAIENGDVDIDRSAMTTEDEVLHWASSLLRKNTSGGLEIAHFTVKEFLLSIDCQKSPHFSPYILRQDEVHIQLARTCLTYLNFETFSQVEPTDSLAILSIVENYPFLPYATVTWDYYALHHLEDATISPLVRQLFRPSVTKQFHLYRLIRQVRGWDSTLHSDDVEQALEIMDVSIFDDSTPLHWAAYLGLDSLCAWLIRQGLSVNQMSSLIGTPLNCALLGHYAIQMTDEDELLEEGTIDPFPGHRPRLQVIQLFLEAGAPPDALTSPVLRLTPLSIAVQSRYPDRCSALVNAGAQFAEFELEVIRDGLYNSTSQAMAECVLEHALTDLHTVLPDAYQILFDIAATYIYTFGSSDGEFAERLLVKLSFQPDALTWASDSIFIELQHLPSFYPLLKGMQCTLQSPEHFPSHLRRLALSAVKSCNIEILSGVLSQDTGALALLTDEGNGMLHIAIGGQDEVPPEGRLQTVELLLKAGHSVQEQNRAGETAFHLAAKSDDVEIFKVLLAAPAEEGVVDIQTNIGLTAFHYALKAGSADIVKLILKHQERLIIHDEAEEQELEMTDISESTSATPLQGSLKRVVCAGDDPDAVVPKKRRVYLDKTLS